LNLTQKYPVFLKVKAYSYINLIGLDDDLPLAVVSIVGKYRTGKSYFVNRVLLNRA
jgi:hypothetical protein